MKGANVNGTMERRFSEEWIKYVQEQGWNREDADMHLQLMRSPYRGKAVAIREELSIRLRQTSNGITLSYPEIARLVGYRSHAAVIAALQRRGRLVRTKIPMPIGMEAGADDGR